MITLDELLIQRMAETDNIADWRALSILFSGLSHRARIAVIEGLSEDRSITEIVDDLDITRGAMQSHLERLIGARLVYRTGEATEPYALTPIGLFFAQLLKQHEDQLLEAVELVNEAEAQAREEFADVPMDEDRIEQEVKRRQWELVDEELYEVLDVPERLP